MKKTLNLLLCLLLVIIMLVGCSNQETPVSQGDNTENNNQDQSKKLKTYEEVYNAEGLLEAINYFDAVYDLFTEEEREAFAYGVAFAINDKGNEYHDVRFIPVEDKTIPNKFENVDYIYGDIYNSKNNTLNIAAFEEKHFVEIINKIKEDDVFTIVKSYYTEDIIYDDGFKIAIHPEIYAKIAKCLDIAFVKDQEGYYSSKEGEPIYGLESICKPTGIVKSSDTSFESKEEHTEIYVETVDKIKLFEDTWKNTIYIPVIIINEEITPKDGPKEETPVKNTDEKTSTDNNTQETSESDSTQNDLIVDGVYQVDVDHYIDMDGDGVDEFVAFKTASGNMVGDRLLIGDSSREFAGFNIESELLIHGFKLIDIDENDNRKEILIECESPPYEITYSIFTYDPTKEYDFDKLVYLTSFDTNCDDNLVFGGEGSFYFDKDSYYVEGAKIRNTYYLYSEWEIEFQYFRDGVIPYVEPIVTQSNDTITVYSQPNVDSENSTLPNETVFTIYYENPDGWLNILPEGSEEQYFWINPADLNHFEIKPFKDVQFHS